MSSTEVETRQVAPPRGSLPEPDGASWLKRGEEVGRYMVLELIGMGGMGRVYRAYDPELDRQVALKLLLPGRGGGAAAQHQLLEEARLTAKLTHPNVVVVHDTGTFGQHVFVAMELIEGETLRSWQSSGQRSLGETLAMFIAAGEGLSAAHAAGVVHLDFKPSNVVVGSDGRARVLDFGLATLAREASTGMGGAETSSTFRGTPAYMPPEQHVAEPTDARADVYSFGVSLWQALYGVLPYFGNTHDELLAAKLANEPMTPQDIDVPPWVQRVLRSTLAPQATDRPGSIREVLDALDADPAQKRNRRIAVGFGAVCLLAIGYFASTATRSERGAPAPAPALCTGSQAAAALVWNDEVREQSRRAFEATGRPYASGAWARVGASLDAFVQQWAAGRDDACADTRVRKEESSEIMDLRLACYGSKLQDVDAMVQVFANADDKVVDNAASAADTLPWLGGCDDVAALRGRATDPSDPTVLARLNEGRAQLRRIRALTLAGKPSEAASEVEAALVIAREVNHAPFVASLLIEKFRSRGTEPAEARQSGLLEAAALARRSGAPELELEAWRELMWSAGVLERQQALGRSAKVYADALAATTALDILQTHRLAEASAALLATSGDIDAAFEAQSALVASIDRPGGPRVELVAALNNLGNIHSMRGEFDEAREQYTRVAAVARELLGDAHPTTLKVRHNLALNRIEHGEAEQTLPELEALLSDKIALYGTSHHSVAAGHAELGWALFLTGKLDAARVEVESGLAMFQELQGERGGGQVNALVFLADIELKAGRLDAAQAAVQQGLKIGPEALGAGNPALASLYASACELGLRRGDANEAVQHCEHAIQLGATAGGEAFEAPALRYLMARALLARGKKGDPVAARIELELAVAQFATKQRSDPVARDEAAALLASL